MTGTWRNTERSGRRHVTRTSSIARRIGGVRHFDCDLYQVCPDCHRPEAFIEVKGILVSDREWDQMRRQADHYSHGCLGILVVESKDALGVKYWDSTSGEFCGPAWGDDDILIKVLEMARDRHQCW